MISSRWIKRHERYFVPVLAAITLALWMAAIAFHLKSLGKLDLSLEAAAEAYRFMFDANASEPVQHTLRNLAGTMLKATLGFAGLYAYLRLIGTNFGRVRLILYFREHVIICGLGRKGRRLAGDLLEQGRKVVVVDQMEHPDEEIELLERGAVIIHGDATQAITLEKAGIAKAGALVTLSGSDQVNVDIAAAAQGLFAGAAQAGTPVGPPAIRRAASLAPLKCVCHIGEPKYRRLLSDHRIFKQNTAAFDARIVTVSDVAACEILHRHPPDRNADIWAAGAAPVHLLLVGTNELMRALIHQFALQAHYPNAVRARVTVVDTEADAFLSQLSADYPALPELLDLVGVSAPGTELRASTIADVERGDGARIPICLAVVALDHDITCISVAHHLSRALESDRGISVVACSNGAGWRQSIASIGHEKRGVVLFDPCELFTARNVLFEQLDTTARAQHERYLEEALADGKSIGGKPALQHWDELDEMIKDWNRHFVQHAVFKRRIAAQILETTDTPMDRVIELLAQVEHRRWAADVMLSGWTHAADYSYERRTNPNLVSWEQLDEATRRYDRQVVSRLFEPGVKGSFDPAGA